MAPLIQKVVLALVLTTLLLTFINISHVSTILLPRHIKRVDKHFFFELLSQHDPVVRHRALLQPTPSPSSSSLAQPAIEAVPLWGIRRAQYKPELVSEFTDVADRVLLVQYLVERFAYSTFLQFSCREQRTYQLLPDNKITTKLCVDAVGGGTHTLDPIRFIADTVISRGQAATSSSSSSSSSTSSSFSSGSLGDSSAGSRQRGYDVILVETRHLPLSITLIDNLLSIVAAGGLLILTDTTDLQSSWREVAILRQRDWLDCATLDADYGITIVTKRRNQSPLDLRYSTTRVPGVVSSSSSSSSTGSNSNSNNNTSIFSSDTTSLGGGTAGREELTATNQQEAKSLTFDRFKAEKQRVLNLLSFEDLHKWLAPDTGNVDLLTAFGGKKGLVAYHEALEYRTRCSALLASTEGSDSDKALACFNDAMTTGRLSPMGRWQFAMLLMSKAKLVEAVTMLGELQAISPAFYKWVILETSLQLTQR